MLDTYWLIQGAHVSLPLGSVNELAISDELAYIELADGVAKPPADANPDNDLIDARAQIQSDPYFNLNQTVGLDRPARHRRPRDAYGVQPPDHIAIARGPDRRRRPGRPVQPRHRVGRRDHRQRRLGNNWRGVSAISVDSLDVYGNDCLVGAADTVEGFERPSAGWTR